MRKKEKRLLYRIILALIVCAVVLVVPKPQNDIFVLLLFCVPYLLAGYDILFRAARNILHGQIFDENFLMSVATLGAFAIGEYFEAVGVMIFYQTGELFQRIAVGKSRRSIASLMDIRPDRAVVLRDNAETEVSPEDVEVGDVIVARAGEKIALDGEIVEGNSLLDYSSLTGESLPQSFGVGDKVISGSVNLEGVIFIRVEKKYEDSTVAKILELVENSASKKSRSEKFITKFARYYTPCVCIGALLLAILPPLVLSEDFGEWIRRALVFLMVSCPCALVISVPLSFFGGIGGASREGILIKGAEYIETLSRLDCVVFDKTGTLTSGTFSVNEISSKIIDSRELLRIAAHVESYATHPIARSVVAKYTGELDRTLVSDIHEIAGKGIRADFEGRQYALGNSALMRELGVSPQDTDSAGKIYICRDGEYLGFIRVGDAVKQDAANALSSLSALGIKNRVMLTGDSREIAKRVSSEVGTDSFFAELLPADKLTKLEEIIAQGYRVAFVGDGINDAPVLCRADVGIAMGGVGSDAAIEAADVVIMDDKLSKIAKLLHLSKKTMRIVRQNIIFALLVKAVILVLSIFGAVSMWWAVFGDVGVSVIAILNATRTMRKEK